MKRNPKIVQSRREFNKAVEKAKRFVQVFQIISQDEKKKIFFVVNAFLQRIIEKIHMKAMS